MIFLPNVPSEDKQNIDRKIAFKFPFNATEILCSDNATIMDLFVNPNKKSENENTEKSDTESTEKDSENSKNKNEEEKKIK